MHASCSPVGALTSVTQTARENNGLLSEAATQETPLLIGAIGRGVSMCDHFGNVKSIFLTLHCLLHFAQ